ncbi:MAG TPA: ABC transporter permease [Symbiobacteriaceae bacterium]
MRNMWLVARREFIFRGKSGAYLISTVMMVIALLASSLLPAILEKQTKTEPLNVLLLDKTQMVAEPLKAAIGALPAGPGSRPVNLSAVTGDEESLMEQTRKEGKSLLIVEGSFPAGLKARFLGANPGALSGSGVVLGPLESIVRAARIKQSGLDPKIAQEILKPMQTETAQLAAKGGTRDQNQFLGAYLLAMGIVMCLYMVILINGQFIFMGVLEEKVSRVMEVMASNVTSGAMLAGKVLGLGALGIIQFAAMIAAWFAGSLVAKNLNSVTSSALSIGNIVLALTYMVLGYLLSATLFAAAASMISRMEDQQTVLTPLVLLIALPMMMLPMLMNNPNSTFAVVVSLIPFFSQSMMVFRVLMTDVPLWQILLSLVLMLASSIGATWAGGRIYRAAMLSYGSRPSLKQVWGYLKAG